MLAYQVREHNKNATREIRTTKKYTIKTKKTKKFPDEAGYVRHMKKEHVLQNTYLLKVADDCCTEEGTRRTETYREKKGENKKSRKQGTKERKSY